MTLPRRKSIYCKKTGFHKAFFWIVQSRRLVWQTGKPGDNYRAPENDKIGRVYNFSHAEHKLIGLKNSIRSYYLIYMPSILPASKVDIPQKLSFGKGNLEKDRRIIQESSYTGSIGIINEDFAEDAKDGLRVKMNGLPGILKSIGDR